MAFGGDRWGAEHARGRCLARRPHAVTKAITPASALAASEGGRLIRAVNSNLDSVEKPEVRALMTMGVAFFRAFRQQDLGIIERAAAELGTNVQVSLRVRPSALRDPLSVVSHRFGFNESDIPRAAEEIRTSRRITLAGMNFEKPLHSAAP